MSKKQLLLAVVAQALASGTAAAQSWPNRPIHIIVGYAPGGGADLNARLVAARMPDYIGQAVVVENKPGAGSNIANEMVAKAAPDGYTLTVNTATIAINMTLYKNVSFDVLRDFQPISMISTAVNVLVINSALPVKSVKELIALARSKPGALNYASAGSGTTQHLTGELFKSLTGADITHIPFKGSAPATTALVGGQVDMTMSNVPGILALAKVGKVRPLAVTGGKRSELIPDVPTMKEQGVDMDVVVWYGLLAPAKMPTRITNRLAEAVGKLVQEPDVRAKLLAQGSEPLGNSPEEFSRILKAEVPTWAAVVKASGATVE